MPLSLFIFKCVADVMRKNMFLIVYEVISIISNIKLTKITPGLLAAVAYELNIRNVL